MDNILEKVHAGGIGNRDTGFVQVIDSCDAGTAAQSGCLIERAVESITESFRRGYSGCVLCTISQVMCLRRGDRESH